MEQVTPAKTRVGFIGLGVMGTSMCGHMCVQVFSFFLFESLLNLFSLVSIKAGYKMTVYNRSKARAQPLIDLGAQWADTPKAVAQASDVVITIVGYPKDVKEVILGEQGVLAGLGKNGVVIDMTTSNPSLAKEIAEEATKKGCHAIDAPVSGGDIGAKEARLSIMIGGETDVVQAVNPIFSVMGKNIRHMGAAGSLCRTLLYDASNINNVRIWTKY